MHRRCPSVGKAWPVLKFEDGTLAIFNDHSYVLKIVGLLVAFFGTLFKES